MKDGGLRTTFRTSLPKFHWTSIESPWTGAGTPDAEYCYAGCEGWVEFKRAQGWNAGMRPEQVGWHMRRARCGGRSFIAVRKGEDLYIYNGCDAKQLHCDGMLNVKPILFSGGGASRWPWLKIERILAPAGAAEKSQFSSPAGRAEKEARKKCNDFRA